MPPEWMPVVVVAVEELLPGQWREHCGRLVPSVQLEQGRIDQYRARP